MMRRGGNKSKPAKAAQGDASTPTSAAGGVLPMTTKPTRTTTNWRTPAFLSRNSSETKLVSSVSNQPPARELSRPGDAFTNSQIRKPTFLVDATQIRTGLECDDGPDATSNSSKELGGSMQATYRQNVSVQSVKEEDTEGTAALDTLQDLTIKENQPSTLSLYSKDSLSIYSSDSASVFSNDSASVFSSDSASIFSSASSIYSSGASMYSFDEYRLQELDEEGEVNLDSRLPGRLPQQQRARPAPTRRQVIQDAASRERSSLVKKAAYFKNSRLPPQLPSFSATLSTWSMVCRAAQASLDCYDCQTTTRRGTYTPADTSKNIKAMIIDDQLMDDSRLVIVSIRGTKFQSLADWAVNKDAKPVKPTGFLDDDENACHAGFLQVAKAMVGQIATQLQQRPAFSERPSLLITGHSAGGAVASLLYSHMVSTSVESDLTALAGHFASVNCVTFGAPPVTVAPRCGRGPGGVFLAFANEGDPVLRLSNSAYVKSLAKLMTASPGANAAAPAVKVIRRSRGSAVIRQPVAAVLPPWEERPLWPTPPPSLGNTGDMILLRGEPNGSATASRVTHEELKDVIFGDFAQHTIEMYIRRVKDVALAAMMGQSMS